MHPVAMGLFDDPTQGRNAVKTLIDCGVPRNTINFLSGHDEAPASLPHSFHQDERVPLDTRRGAAAGGMAGGVLGLLAGMGVVVIPGLGPLLAAGALVCALAGVGLGGATGGLVGALVGWGAADDEAHTYVEGVRRGGTLIVVTAEDDKRAAEIEAILRCEGAVDIATRAGAWRHISWVTGKPEETV